MIERHRFVPVENPLIKRGDATYSDPGDACFDIEGVHYCPGSAIMVGSSRGFVRVLLRSGEHGFYFNLTPLGGRSVADTLRQAADRVDAELDAVNAQLAATLAKKGDRP